MTRWGEGGLRSRREVLRILPFLVLVYGLVPAPAQAQFAQEGPKLVGLGVTADAQRGTSVSRSADASTAIVDGHSDTNDAGAAWVYSTPAIRSCREPACPQRTSRSRENAGPCSPRPGNPGPVIPRRVAGLSFPRASSIEKANLVPGGPG